MPDGKIDPQPWLTETLGDNITFAIRGGRRLATGRSCYQTLQAWETNSAFGRLYRLDDAFMAAEGDEFIYHENLVFPAAMTHPAPTSDLILGGGDGGSARRLLQLPGLDRILMVELDQAVVDLARAQLGAIHQGSMGDPRVEIRIQDALGYLCDGGPDERFDLILFDLTDPLGAAAPLYQAPCLDACRKVLAEGGILTLHTASPFYQPQRLQGLIGALAAVFPVVRPFFFPTPLYGGWWGMACASMGPDPTTLLAEEVERRLAARGIHGLRYYNGAVHQAQFALPNFLRDSLFPHP